MKIVFDKKFNKDLKKIKRKSILNQVEKSILASEKAAAMKHIPNLKKLKGHKSYYRIRVGDYRIGIEREGRRKLRFVTIIHRKDIYKKFP